MNGATQKVSPALLTDQALIHLSRGQIGGPGQLHVDEPLIMAQVQVGLAPVFSDKDLTVLVGGHGAGIKVKVGV